jgi:phage terminase Nu1 subunit (DNA packaging protein)
VSSPPVLERYVTAGELAELMGVSLRTVKAWTAAGMPSESWGMRVRRYRPSEAIAWARARDTMNGGRARDRNAPRTISQPKG